QFGVHSLLSGSQLGFNGDRSNTNSVRLPRSTPIPNSANMSQNLASYTLSDFANYYPSNKGIAATLLPVSTALKTTKSGIERLEEMLAEAKGVLINATLSYHEDDPSLRDFIAAAKHIPKILVGFHEHPKGFQSQETALISLIHNLHVELCTGKKYGEKHMKSFDTAAKGINNAKDAFILKIFSMFVQIKPEAFALAAQDIKSEFPEEYEKWCRPLLPDRNLGPDN
ncbi:hypothetical protein BCR34DRAFT_637031, partial [Clohesyomyces aquaticus]